MKHLGESKILVVTNTPFTIMLIVYPWMISQGMDMPRWLLSIFIIIFLVGFSDGVASVFTTMPESMKEDSDSALLDTFVILAVVNFTTVVLLGLVAWSFPSIRPYVIYGVIIPLVSGILQYRKLQKYK